MSNLQQVNDKYFFCYSINLFRYIRNNGICYISKGTNPNTKRNYWLYEKNTNLSNILKEWTFNKPLKQ
jgi:hypothetical protein